MASCWSTSRTRTTLQGFFILKEGKKRDVRTFLFSLSLLSPSLLLSFSLPLSLSPSLCISPFSLHLSLSPRPQEELPDDLPEQGVHGESRPDDPPLPPGDRRLVEDVGRDDGRVDEGDDRRERDGDARELEPVDAARDGARGEASSSCCSSSSSSSCCSSSSSSSCCCSVYVDDVVLGVSDAAAVAAAVVVVVIALRGSVRGHPSGERGCRGPPFGGRERVVVVGDGEVTGGSLVASFGGAAASVGGHGSGGRSGAGASVPA